MEIKNGVSLHQFGLFQNINKSWETLTGHWLIFSLSITVWIGVEGDEIYYLYYEFFVKVTSGVNLIISTTKLPSKNSYSAATIKLYIYKNLKSLSYAFLYA